MTKAQTLIQNVSDTSLWVAYYRSVETERPDALFRDPLAKLLIEDRGQQIAESMKQSSAHTQFNVLIRTVIIDRFIQNLVSKGVDCVLNLGAGMDTRPYRLELPASLRWIEIDYSQIIELKEHRLASEIPKCQLRRFPLDLTDRLARTEIFSEINKESSNILVLTEGVLPYLTQDQVATLAEDLLGQSGIQYWIADYISPAVYKYIRTPERNEKMKNAPFQFYPDDWFGFFESRGWHPDLVQYLPEEGLKLGRRLPVPWWSFILKPFLTDKAKQQLLRPSGYMLMRRLKSPAVSKR